MKKGIVFPVDAEASIVDVKEPIRFNDIAKKLGFEWCEIVRPRGLTRPYVMIVDEEGLLKNAETNFTGSYLYGALIVGNIMILKEEMGPEGPEVFGLDETEAELLLAKLTKGGN